MSPKLCYMQSKPRLSASFKTREQAAYDALREAIVSGRWGPDEPLVGSRIADDLGVSRLTVANALKRLAAEGFVELVPHKEAVVARLDRAAVRELYLMRAELEALAAREAVAHITEEDIASARALNDEIRRHWMSDPLDIKAIRSVDRAFHRRIREAARLPRLTQLLENLADQGEAYRARVLDQAKRATPNPDAHEELLRLLTARDARGAAEFMREHILAGMHAILSALEEPG